MYFLEMKNMNLKLNIVFEFFRDFDLEAHIATLPACCIENMSRRRGFARQRHSSDTCPNRKPEEMEEPGTRLYFENYDI